MAGILFIGAEGRNAVTRWYPLDEVPDDYVVIDDQGARGEAEFLRRELKEAERKETALSLTMSAAVKLLTDSQAEHMREHYRRMYERSA